MIVKEICNKIKNWWRKFVKDHIIDKVDDEDPNF